MAFVFHINIFMAFVIYVNKFLNKLTNLKRKGIRKLFLFFYLFNSVQFTIYHFTTLKWKKMLVFSGSKVTFSFLIENKTCRRAQLLGKSFCKNANKMKYNFGNNINNQFSHLKNTLSGKKLYWQFRNY